MNRAWLVAAFLGAATIGVAALHFIQPSPEPQAVSAPQPELAMPATTKIGAPPEPSSLMMVRGEQKASKPSDELVAPPPPKPAPPVAKPKPDELRPIEAPKPPPEEPPQKKAPPKLRPISIDWKRFLFNQESQNIKPPEAPKEQPKPQPPAPKELAAPPPKAPEPPPEKPKPPRRVIRHPGSPPGTNPVQIGPSVTVQPAPPPPQGELAAPQPPPRDASPQPVDNFTITHGPPDTPPPPSPAAGTASGCLKPGAFKNSWTGVCYDTRDLCQKAEPRGQCFQPPQAQPKKAAPN